MNFFLRKKKKEEEIGAPQDFRKQNSAHFDKNSKVLSDLPAEFGLGSSASLEEVKQAAAKCSFFHPLYSSLLLYHIHLSGSYPFATCKAHNEKSSDKKKKDKDNFSIGAPIVGSFSHTAHAQLDPNSPSGFTV